MFSKNKSEDEFKEDDENKINLGEFKIFISYLKKYLELMGLFVQLDYDGS